MGKHWVGAYSSKNKILSLYASPQAVAELDLTPLQGAQHTAKVQARSIKPGSEHLKRTGWTRGIDEN